MLSKHLSFLTTSLRCFYEILSGLGADELLHLSIATINFFQEKEFHNEYCLDGSFSNKDLFTCQLWAELNVWWSTFQRSSISIYSHPLNWIALMASHFCFLIQFIRFYGLWFFMWFLEFCCWRIIILYSSLSSWSLSILQLSWMLYKP